MYLENRCNKNDYAIKAGDLNTSIGNQRIDNIVGTFEEICLNGNGKEVRNSFNKLKLTNTLFRKKDINKYTWSKRGARSFIDYIITIENYHLKLWIRMYLEHLVFIQTIYSLLPN